MVPPGDGARGRLRARRVAAGAQRPGAPSLRAGGGPGRALAAHRPDAPGSGGGPAVVRQAGRAEPLAGAAGRSAAPGRVPGVVLPAPADAAPVLRQGAGPAPAGPPHGRPRGARRQQRRRPDTDKPGRGGHQPPVPKRALLLPVPNRRRRRGGTSQHQGSRRSAGTVATRSSSSSAPTWQAPVALVAPSGSRRDQLDAAHTLQLLHACSLAHHLDLELVMPDEMSRLLYWLGPAEQGACGDLIRRVPQLPNVSALSLRIRWGFGGGIAPSLASLLSRTPGLTRLRMDASPYCFAVSVLYVLPSFHALPPPSILRIDDDGDMH
ncbi:uncharacterized protein LOC112883098 isoform X1 [Panicum hallii]|uniref:uncharacterized protein LOC112883098 isoform X1 n=1 Tax=Panicum hallii TaxID=206008 RepID=UPI000DF4CAA7|nr:uncharacterized protein LOC112883098 isoform X1 [Panicum hallii]